MNLTLTDEQRQLSASYARLLERDCPTQVVRAAEAGDGWAPTLWRRLNHLGLADLGVPESLGGQGAGLLECALAIEEAGRRLAPVPVIEAVVVGRLHARLGMLVPPDIRNEPNHPVTVAPAPAAGGWWHLVPWGAVAGAVVGRSGDQLLLVRRLERYTRRSELGGGAVCDWPTAVADRGGTVVCGGRRAEREFAFLMADQSTLAAAWLVGLAAGALQLAVTYTSQRRAFGMPVAAFQAVAHRLADLATAVDGARLLAQEAAWTIDEDPVKGCHLATMALMRAAATAVDTSSACVHLHGGYGFMLEYDPQLFFRRAMSYSVLYRASHRAEQLADELFAMARG